MADTTAPAGKTPWHLWVVGILSLLWNIVGVVDYTMTQTGNEAYLKGLTSDQLEYLDSFPIWVVVAWGIAVWGGLLGSTLILLRRSAALHLFVASLVGMVLTNIYSHILSDGREIMGGGAGAVIFNAVIFVIGVLLLLYSRSMCKRGALR